MELLRDGRWAAVNDVMNIMFRNMQGISWHVENLLTYYEGIYSMELLRDGRWAVVNDVMNIMFRNVQGISWHAENLLIY